MALTTALFINLLTLKTMYKAETKKKWPAHQFRAAMDFVLETGHQHNNLKLLINYISFKYKHV